LAQITLFVVILVAGFDSVTLKSHYILIIKDVVVYQMLFGSTVVGRYIEEHFQMMKD
jgi:hypothetical protein